MCQALCHLSPRKSNKTGFQCRLLPWWLLQSSAEGPQGLIEEERRHKGSRTQSSLSNFCIRQKAALVQLRTSRAISASARTLQPRPQNWPKPGGWGALAGVNCSGMLMERRGPSLMNTPPGTWLRPHPMHNRGAIFPLPAPSKKFPPWIFCGK